jgi:hypothetical protein
MRGFWNLFRKNVTEKFQSLSEPTGFENQTDTTLTWADGTTTFTLAPASGTTFEFWLNSDKKIMPTQTLVGDGTDFTIAQGLWFFYFDATGTLVAGQTAWELDKHVPVAILFWDNANSKGLLGEERHSQAMPWRTHQYLHTTVGTRYGGSGLVGTFNPTTMQVTAGSIWDEDIENEIAQQTQCRVFFKDATANFEWTAKQNFIHHDVSNIVQYNNVNALADVTNNRHVAYWVVATNMPDAPVISIMGQREDVNLQDAKDNNEFSSLSFGAMPTVEWRVLYRVILKRSGTDVIVSDTQDLRNASQLPGSTFVASSHANLTDLDEDDHAQYQLVAETETIYIPAAAMVPDTTTPAEAITNDYAPTEIDAYAFDSGSDEHVHFTFPFPETWNLGTVKAKFYWTTATGSADTEDVEWAIAAVGVGDEDTIDASHGTAVTVNDALTAANGTELQISAATGAITIGGTLVSGDLHSFLVYRDVSAESTGPAEDAWLFGVMIEYTKDVRRVAW